MKKLVIILCALFLLVAFCSCSNNIENTSNSTVINTEGNMVQKSEYKTLEEINNIFVAYPIDVKEAEKKGLAENGKINKNYYIIKEGYMDLLNQYLCSKINLEKYQAEFDNSANNYNCTNNDCTKKFGSFGRNNIIIRNNLYIERLTVNQIEIIEKYISGEEVAIEALNVVEETYNDIIALYYQGENQVLHTIIYDIDGFTGIKGNNNSVLIEIRYDIEYDKNGNQADELERTKYALASEIGELIKSDSKLNLGQEAVVTIN